MLRPPVLLCLSLALAACAPDTRAVGGDPDGGVDPTGPDASFVDGAPLPDGGDEAFLVYVHTRDTLYTLDPVTFQLAMVGGFDAPGDDRITDLAVATDGTIYVISQTKLYTADADDAHVTFVANLSSSPSGGNVGLTFLPDGKLLATDEAGGVRRIDPASGQVVEIGAFGNGLATAGDLVATADGTMYAISDKHPDHPDAFENNWLLTVDTATGAGRPVGAIGASRVFGAAFINGKVLVFTSEGDVVQVDPTTGAGTPRASTGVEFWGAGVTPLVPGVD